MSAQKFEKLKNQFLPQIETKLASFLKESLATPMNSKMTSYHFETGGKRLRALIPLYVYQVLGHDPEKALLIGAAVEMIHNATLVHDDLQDGDEVRRNRPTLWKKYSPAQAINCGDAMFQYAYRLLAQLHIESDRLVRLIDRAALSTLQVIEGQAQEFVMKEEDAPGVDRYLEVVRGKTSGLFALPIVGAMESLGLRADLCSVVEQAAMDLGMLFQIQDDLLDIYASKGRDQIATDVAEGKISILVAHVNAVANAADRQELSAILKKPREQTSAKDIARALQIFEAHGAKAMAIAKIREIQQQIKSDGRLEVCPEIRDLLLEMGEVFLEPVRGIL